LHKCQNYLAVSISRGKTTPHNHPIHRKAAIHNKVAPTPGPAQLKENTTTAPPHPHSRSPRRPRNVRPVSSHFCPLRGQAGPPASPSAFGRFLPVAPRLARRGEQRRRGWRRFALPPPTEGGHGAQHLPHRLRQQQATVSVNQAHQSFQRRRARAPCGPQLPRSPFQVGSAEDGNRRERPRQSPWLL